MQEIQHFPPIPDTLLNALEKAFPEARYTPGCNIADLAFHAGSRAVLDKLRWVAERQRVGVTDSQE